MTKLGSAACDATNAGLFDGILTSLLGGITVAPSYVWGSDWGRTDLTTGIDTLTKRMNGLFMMVSYHSYNTVATAYTYLAAWGCSPFYTADQASKGFTQFFDTSTGKAKTTCHKHFNQLFGWLAAPVQGWGMNVCADNNKLKQVSYQVAAKVETTFGIAATATGGNWYTVLSFMKMADRQMTPGTDQLSGAWKLSVGNKTACDETFKAGNAATALYAFGSGNLPQGVNLGVSQTALMLGNWLWDGKNSTSKTLSEANNNLVAFRLHTAWVSTTGDFTSTTRASFLTRLRNCCNNNNTFANFERCVRIASSTKANTIATVNDALKKTNAAVGSFYYAFPATNGAANTATNCTANIRPYLGGLTEKQVLNLENHCGTNGWLRTQFLAIVTPATEPSAGSVVETEIYTKLAALGDFNTLYQTNFLRPNATRCNALFPTTVDANGKRTGNAANMSASMSQHLTQGSSTLQATTISNFATLSASTTDQKKANLYAYGCCVMNDSNANMVKCLNWAFQTNLASKSVDLWGKTGANDYTKSACDTLMRTLPGVTNATELATWVGHCTNATTRAALKAVTEKTTWPTGANKWLGTSGLESLHNGALPKPKAVTPAPAPKTPAPAPKTPTPTTPTTTTTFTPAAGNFKCEVKGLGCEQVSTADNTKKIALKAATVNTCTFGAILKALGVTLLTTLIMNLLN